MLNSLASDRLTGRSISSSTRRARRIVALLAGAVMGTVAAASGAAQAAAAAPTADQFQVGDVVVLDVSGVPALSDTFPVRDGLVLQLPNIPPLSLVGVRRGEVQAHLAQELGRYLVNPTVRAYALITLGVMGAVETPGFYQVRADAPLNEVLMRAGGLTQEANADKIEVRRGGQTVIGEQPMRSALATAATVEALQLRTGDQLLVKERRRIGWMDVVRNGAYLAGVAVSLYAGRALF